MRRFERQADGSVVAEIEDAEVTLLTTLTHQAAAVVGDADLDDPAVQRILPDAYPDDAEASAEFRRFTQADLAGRKLANAARILDCLERVDSGSLTLGHEDVTAWLRGLTDIRLILATRLGIETDDDLGASADPMMRDVYDWLGFVQNSLVEAIDA
ncbi:DUF2017 domain-containing protein [Salinibacterium sp. SYSU T00001]|uniref:DUF2017 domain-containing protein n=1 Tax=Homoserinimonas sedimenticola TaxID=2986805 RepID=UPI00223600C1|nr:DUF2017 domain-containing protein [Salinibacterium sedimenticola]MCW4384743.1 DUF2017 domain-containing protein [Salinibacterium sedimenticola]